jgi:hypothetical protein
MHTRYSARRARSMAAVAVFLGTALPPGRCAPSGGPAPLPSGRIHYQMTSPIMSGTMILSWIDNGKKFRQDTKASAGTGAERRPGGQKTQFETWSIGDGTHVYTYAPGMGRQVMRAKVPRSMGAGSPTAGTPFGGMHGAGPVVGKATVLGKRCDVRKIGQGGGQGKVWLWKGLVMRMEASAPQGGSMNMIATRLEEAPRLSPSLFRVPAGYQVRDFQLPAGRRGGARPPSR